MNLVSLGMAAAGSSTARLYVRARPHIPALLQTHLDIAWTAMDVASHTRYNQPSEFTDLVAGGNRECLGDQPDLFYSAAYIDVSPGREYLMRIPRSNAVCTHVVMTSHKEGVSTQTSWATRSPEEASQEQVVRICESPNDPTVLDTSPHQGLCVTFVRQYFLDPVDASKYEDHRPQVEMKNSGMMSRHMLPPSVAVTWRFLPIRQLTITLKFLSFLLAAKRSPNVWKLTNVDHRRGWGARIKEVLVNDRGRYFFLDLSLRERETLEVLYQPTDNTWSSMAFVTPSTRTCGYLNLCRMLPESDGFIHLKVSPEEQHQLTTLSTQGRRKGTLILREVSTDGRSLGKDVDVPLAVMHRRDNLE